jgi:hypothetical protein
MAETSDAESAATRERALKQYQDRQRAFAEQERKERNKNTKETWLVLGGWAAFFALCSVLPGLIYLAVGALFVFLLLKYLENNG